MKRLVFLAALLIAGGAHAQGGGYPAVKSPAYTLTLPLGWEVKQGRESTTIRGPRGEHLALREAVADASLPPDKRAAEVQRMRAAFGDVARAFFLENRTQGEFFTEDVKRPDGTVKLSLTIGVTESWTKGQALLQFIASGPGAVIWMRGTAPSYSIKETVDTLRTSFRVIEWQP